MPESTTHLGLVRHLAIWVERNPIDSGNVVVYIDEPSRDAANKPPRLLGYTPDLYCKNLEATRILVGEAKSAYEVESRHSRKQFAAFLTHLQLVDHGIFLLAVPWHVVPQAKSLIRAIQRETLTTHVRTVFLDYLPG